MALFLRNKQSIWIKKLLTYWNYLQHDLDESKAFQVFQVLRQGAGIIIAISLANFGLSKSAIGNYEKLWYVGNTLSFFWVAGLIQSLLTHYPGLNEEKKPVFFFNIYLSFVGISGLVCAVLFIFQQSILEFFTQKEELKYFSLFLIFIFINWPTYIVENLYLLKKKAWPIVTFGLLAFIGQVLAVSLPIFLGYTLEISFYCLILLAIIKHIWLLSFIIRASVFKVDIPEVRQWFVLALPLIGYALLGGLNLAFDQWIVNYEFDGNEEKFAIFRYGARELPLALALASAFSTAMLPGISENLNRSLEVIKKRSVRLFHILFGISILLMLSSQWIFPLVFTKAFNESIPIFNTYLLIVVSRLIFSRTVLMGLKDNIAVLWISLIELLTNIALSFLLITTLGLVGTAIATVVAYTLEKILISAYLYAKYKIPVQAYTNLRWYTVYSVTLLICYGMSFFI